jgi:hypothetical protein
MITEAYLDSPASLSFGLAYPRNMNIRSSKQRFRVTFVTFGCLPREQAGGTEYLFGERAFRCEPCVNFGPGGWHNSEL